MNRSVGVLLHRAPGATALTGLAIGIAAGAWHPSQVQAAPAAPQVSLPYHSVAFVERAREAAQPVAVVYVEAPPPPPPPPPPAQPMRRSVTPRFTSTERLPRAFAPPRGSGGIFPFGQCTWWVAHKRHIPWRGNAWEWWWAARSYGFAEGWRPRVGAIMVMGYSWSSPWGHVAYVEAVYPDGSFLVSEMNWWGVPGGGWGRVDYRHVKSMRGILGFIY